MSDDKKSKFGEGVKFRPKGIPVDKIISRDRLGQPNTVKVQGIYGPETAVLRPCICVECVKAGKSGKFMNATPSILCPDCEAELSFALGLLDDVPDGSLPPMVTRTRGVSKPVSATGVRPKVQGDVVKK